MNPKLFDSHSCLFNKRQFQLDRCHKIPMPLKRLPGPRASLTQYSNSISYMASFYMKLCEVTLLEKSTSQFKFSSKCTTISYTREYQQKLDQSYFLGGKMAFHNLQLQFLCGLFIWQSERLFGIIYGTSKRFHNTFCVHQCFATFGFFLQICCSEYQDSFQ